MSHQHRNHPHVLFGVGMALPRDRRTVVWSTERTLTRLCCPYGCCSEGLVGRSPHPRAAANTHRRMMLKPVMPENWKHSVHFEIRTVCFLSLTSQYGSSLKQLSSAGSPQIGNLKIQPERNNDVITSSCWLYFQSCLLQWLFLTHNNTSTNPETDSHTEPCSLVTTLFGGHHVFERPLKVKSINQPLIKK